MRTPRREFPVEVMRQAWARCKGFCEGCTAPLSAGKIDYDHVVPNALGGEPTLGNCAVLCRTCHKLKTASQDVPNISQAKSRNEKHFGMRNPKRGSFGSPYLKRRMDGTVSRRDGA